MELFRFDRAAALKEITDPEGALWPLNAFSDADELNALADDALTCGVVARSRPAAHFAIYPMSLSEPDPVLAVNLGAGPALLGHSLKLRERESESPVEFTLRLLRDITAEANALASHPDLPSAAEERES